MRDIVAGWNGLDWLLVAILVVSTVRAVMRGLLQALFGLAGLICGFATAGWKHVALAAWIVHKGWLASPEVARVVCYLVILFCVLLGFGIAGSLARRTARAAGLGTADRLLGGILGAARGVLLGVALVLMVQAVAPHAELLRRSRLSSYFLAAGHGVSFVVPHTLR